MILLSVRRLLRVAIFICLCSFSHAQPAPSNDAENARAYKPYKILTTGKQVNVKSTKEIKSVIVWTATGHRIVEEKAVNATSFSFNINVTEKVFFIRIQFEGSKPYTEKIGVQ
ncbi:MAG: hypothetical protein ACHQFX_06190 [Chitinophagales bacterium]